MKVLLLGATGSIAKTYLELRTDHKLVGISYFNNHELAKKIIHKYQLKHYYSPNKKYQSTCDSFSDLINQTKPDLVINAIVGVAGLKASIATIKAGINLALANKESLVIAGHFIKDLLQHSPTKLIPIDSEHTSLLDLIINSKNKFKKLFITCSGGRYYKYDKNDLKKISYQEAICHPNWNMGQKISIDSATLMNKCFELVEAYYLFNTDNVQALYHPQSIIHSIVQFQDNSYFVNMSKPDMSLSIALAVNDFSKSAINAIEPLNFKQMSLVLEEIDPHQWKPIQWAYDIMHDQNNCLGLIINVANEKAIELFKNNKITFDQIYPVIEWYIKQYHTTIIANLDQLFDFLNHLRAHEFDINLLKNMA